MPGASPAAEFQYTILRLVPAIERGERVNVAVVLFCRRMAFLGGRAHVDEARLAALAPDVDPVAVRAALQALCDIVAGRAAGGPLAALPPSERFGWVAAPSSTMIQPSPTHTGLTHDPAATLERLFDALVATPVRR